MEPADFRNASQITTSSDKKLVKVTTALNKQDYYATISSKYMLFLHKDSGVTVVDWKKILTDTEMCLLV